MITGYINNGGIGMKWLLDNKEVIIKFLSMVVELLKSFVMLVFRRK
jgi:hypothetical protein